MNVKNLAIGLLVVGLATSLAAQSGSYLGGRAAVLFSKDTNLGLAKNRGAEVFVKPSGLPTSRPDALAGGSGVDFAIGKMLRACKGRSLAVSDIAPVIDAFSIGRDQILVNPADGQVSVPDDRYGGVAYSLAGKGGGTMYHYTFPVPRGHKCPPADAGVNTVAWTGKDAGFPAGSDMDAVDLYAALYADETYKKAGLPTDELHVYFSVKSGPEGVGRVPDLWWNKKPKSGATIFRSTWTGTGWSCPQGHWAPADLGITRAEDVDALAVDGKSVMFSTTRGMPLRRQFLIVAAPGPGPRGLVAVQDVKIDDKSLEEEIGLDSADEVDAFCGTDPGCVVIMELGRAPLEILGTTARPPLVVQQSSWLHAQRNINAQGNSTYVCSLSGAKTFGILYADPAGAWPRFTLPILTFPITANAMSVSFPVPSFVQSINLDLGVLSVGSGSQFEFSNAARLYLR